MQEGVSHIGYMKNKTEAPNRIAEVRKAKGMTQQQLADAVGGHWITISRLERGIMRLSDEWREKLAAALGVDEWSLLANVRPLPTVHVEGFIEEGGRIVPYDDEGDLDTFSLNTQFFSHPSFRWLVVAGDALWPWYQDGDRLCILNVDVNETESLRGRICVVWYETAKGEEVTIGVLERGTRAGLYTISRTGMPPVRDIKIISLAAVAMAVYDLGEWTIPST